MLCYLLTVIGELNFVEDLGAVLLNCFNLYLVRWKLSGLHSSIETMTNLVFYTVNTRLLNYHTKSTMQFSSSVTQLEDSFQLQGYSSVPEVFEQLPLQMKPL